MERRRRTGRERIYRMSSAPVDKRSKPDGPSFSAVWTGPSHWSARLTKVLESRKSIAIVPVLSHCSRRRRHCHWWPLLRAHPTG